MPKGVPASKVTKEQAKQKLAEGERVSQVARDLGFYPQTVHRWLRDIDFKEDVEARQRSIAEQREGFQRGIQQLGLDILPDIKKRLKKLAREGNTKELDTLLKWLDAAGFHAKHNPKQTSQQQQGSNFALLVQQLSQQESSESPRGHRPVLEGEVTDDESN